MVGKFPSYCLLWESGVASSAAHGCNHIRDCEAGVGCPSGVSAILDEIVYHGTRGATAGVDLVCFTLV